MRRKQNNDFFILSYFCFTLSMISYPVWPFVNLSILLLCMLLFIFSVKLKIKKNNLIYILISIFLSLILGYLYSEYLVKSILFHGNILILIVFPIFLLCIIIFLANIIFFRKYKGKIIGLFSIILALVPILFYLKYDYIRNPLFVQIEKDLKEIGFICRVYSQDNKGHFPQNLEVLKEQKYFQSIPNSPIKEIDYTYLIKSWNSSDFTILCPNEETEGKKYKRKPINKIYYTHKKGFIIESKQ